MAACIESCPLSPDARAGTDGVRLDVHGVPLRYTETPLHAARLPLRRNDETHRERNARAAAKLPLRNAVHAGSFGVLVLPGVAEGGETVDREVKEH